MLVTSRKRPPPISYHLSKTPKFSQSKAFSWNLLKRPPLVRDRSTCGVRSQSMVAVRTRYSEYEKQFSGNMELHIS